MCSGSPHARACRRAPCRSLEQLGRILEPAPVSCGVRRAGERYVFSFNNAWLDAKNGVSRTMAPSTVQQGGGGDARLMPAAGGAARQAGARAAASIHRPWPIRSHFRGRPHAPIPSAQLSGAKGVGVALSHPAASWSIRGAAAYLGRCRRGARWQQAGVSGCLTSRGRRRSSCVLWLMPVPVLPPACVRACRAQARARPTTGWSWPLGWGPRGRWWTARS